MKSIVSTLARAKGAAKRFESQALFVFIAAGLFFWPLWTVKNMEHPFRLYFYTYGVWAMVIGGLYFVSQNLGDDKS